MKYTFLLYSDQSAAGEATAEEKEQELAVYGAYIGALQEAGVQSIVFAGSRTRDCQHRIVRRRRRRGP